MRISDWSSYVCSSDLLIGNFGQYHGSTVAAPFLDFVARTHDDRSTPRLIGRTRARLAEDQPARRKIRAGNDLEQFIHSDAGIVYIGQAGGHDFAQIMRRNVGRPEWKSAG